MSGTAERTSSPIPADPAWLDDTEQAAWRGFLQMHREVMGYLAKHFQDASGISVAEFAVLAEISEGDRGEIRFRDLATQLQWDSPRLSHQLRRMEQRGMVRRAKVPGDARGVLVGLTELGQGIVADAAARHVGEVRRLFFDVLTSDQVAAYRDITDRVRAKAAQLADPDHD